MKAGEGPPELLDADLAVSHYLDGLFSEAPTATAPRPLSPGDGLIGERIRTEALNRLLSTTPAPAPGADSGMQADPPHESSVPFQVILLELAGLKLALPLHELNGILKYPSRLSQVPFPAPWVLGIHATGERNTRIVDTTALLLPPRYRSQAGARPADDQQHLIVLIGNGEWGLDCLAASDVIELQPQQVNWRPDRRTRPWLAGTVREHLCALLDTAAFVSWLEQGAPED